ncbi:hypothetical protein [Sciscionella marina]|uniref:hypothetical protein n=1 Tax=Sciscionella marina TaxID=508770 RepID=UPI0012F70717|nr:hypothetical protein [Sciscionella marina]
MTKGYSRLRRIVVAARLGRAVGPESVGTSVLATPAVAIEADDLGVGAVGVDSDELGVLDVPSATDVPHARVDQCSYPEDDHAADEVPSDHNHRAGDPDHGHQSGRQREDREEVVDEDVQERTEDVLVDYWGGK